jgi:hypothetical protein
VETYVGLETAGMRVPESMDTDALKPLGTASGQHVHGAA